MTISIIDDEEPAVQILSNFVAKVPFLDLQLATTDAYEGLEWINNQKTDLLLLDIEMPDITGLDLLKCLAEKPLIIFTTAYEEFALKGYELDVVDYLMKPIPFNRFLKGISKAHNLFKLKSKIEPPKENFLFLKVEYKTVKIAFDNILYIEGLKDYVKVHTTQGMILTRLNIKGIYEKLPPVEFIRIHRSYIVAFSKIISFQKNHLLIEDKRLPISKTFREAVLKRFI